MSRLDEIINPTDGYSWSEQNYEHYSDISLAVVVMQDGKPIPYQPDHDSKTLKKLSEYWTGITVDNEDPTKFYFVGKDEHGRSVEPLPTISSYRGAQFIAKLRDDRLNEIAESDLAESEGDIWRAEKQAKSALATFKERAPVGSGEFLREADTTPAFIVTGKEIVVRDLSAETYKAAILKAKNRGWDPLEVQGTPEQMGRCWIEAQLLGVGVANFIPTPELENALDARRASARQQEEAQQRELVRTAAVAHNADVVHEGRYVGPVTAVTNEVVIQKVGRDRFIAHPSRDLFCETPKVGETLDVQYEDGRPQVREFEQERELSR